ncbi:MAG: HNH endonuclease [Thiotrichaceae bacterium]|nr:HNH endonuclease [Thiotrichaceae bacterium]
MLNADRNCVEAPKMGKNYRTETILDALDMIFLKKCYLCEVDQIIEGVFEVDHFKPKAIYPELEYEWNNLYLCCETCNLSKADTDNLLDPCKDDVENMIFYTHDYEEGQRQYIPHFFVSNIDDENNTQLDNTINLLEKIHNNKKGKLSIRASLLRLTISTRRALMMDAYAEYRTALDTDDNVKRQQAINKLKSAVSKHSPFTMLMRYTAKKYHFDKQITDLFD